MTYQEIVLKALVAAQAHTANNEMDQALVQLTLAASRLARVLSAAPLDRNVYKVLGEIQTAGIWIERCSSAPWLQGSVQAALGRTLERARDILGQQSPPPPTPTS